MQKTVFYADMSMILYILLRMNIMQQSNFIDFMCIIARAPTHTRV